VPLPELPNTCLQQRPTLPRVGHPTVHKLQQCWLDRISHSDSVASMPSACCCGMRSGFITVSAGSLTQGRLKQGRLMKHEMAVSQDGPACLPAQHLRWPHILADASHTAKVLHWRTAVAYSPKLAISDGVLYCN
jgi:hypothetical protein